MKQILIFLGLIFTISNCSISTSKEFSESDLYFKTTFIGYITGPFEKPEFSYLMINADLVNNTNRTYEFVAYNCLTAANLVTEPSFIKPLTYECSRNYPTVIRLKPGQELTMPIILECPYTSRSIGSKLKIGFILISPNGLNSDKDLYTILTEKRVKKENVIWSDPVSLDRGNGEAFKIRSTCDSIVE